MAVSKRVRYEVLRRDGHRCRYCGATPDDGATLTVDHVVPVSLGGGDDPSNLVAACRDCNAGKTSSHPDAPLVADVADDAQRWAAAMAAAASQLERNLDALQSYRDAFLEQWDAWTFGYKKIPYELPPNWADMVDRWNAAGLPAPVLADSVRITMNGPADHWSKFPYLCGVVRNRLGELRDKAKAIFDEATAEPFECQCDVNPDGEPHRDDRDCTIHWEGNVIGEREGRTNGEWWAAQTGADRLLQHVVDGRHVNPSGPDDLWSAHPLSRLIWAA